METSTLDFAKKTISKQKSCSTFTSSFDGSYFVKIARESRLKKVRAIPKFRLSSSFLSLSTLNVTSRTIDRSMSMSASTRVAQDCAVCPEKTRLVCSKCKVVPFCSPECQKLVSTSSEPQDTHADPLRVDVVHSQVSLWERS